MSYAFPARGTYQIDAQESGVQEGWLKRSAAGNEKPASLMETLASRRRTRERNTLSAQILSSYVSRTGSTAHARMLPAQFAMPFTLNSPTKQKLGSTRYHDHPAKVSHAGTMIVDFIFNELESLIEAYNKGAAANQVTTTGPALVAETRHLSRFESPGEPRYFYRGRISTWAQSLVVRSADGKVEVFRIPSSEVLGLSDAESGYRAVLTLDIDVDGYRIECRHQDRILSKPALACMIKDMYSLFVTAANAA